MTEQIEWHPESEPDLIRQFLRDNRRNIAIISGDGMTFLEMACGEGFNAAIRSARKCKLECAVAARELRRFLVNHSVSEKGLEELWQDKF